MKEKITPVPSRFTFILKCLLLSYLLTTGLLLLLSLMLYRFQLSEQIVTICITCIYILVTFLAGFLFGKREGNRKFLWGLLAGILYFLILFLLSMITAFPPYPAGFLLFSFSAPAAACWAECSAKKEAPRMGASKVTFDLS